MEVQSAGSVGGDEEVAGCCCSVSWVCWIFGRRCCGDTAGLSGSRVSEEMGNASARSLVGRDEAVLWCCL